MHRIIRVCIGVFELVGGILGVAMIATEAWSARTLDITTMVFGGMYIALILAGIALLRACRFGGLLSLIIQIAQLPRVAAAGCAYQFAAGAGLWAMVGNSGVGVSHTLGNQFAWSTAAAAEPMPFGVNIIAAVIIALLLAVPVPKKVRKKKDDNRPLAFA